MILSGKRLWTVTALEWRFAGVLPHMIHEVFASRKRFRTEIATVRGFACVLPDVVQ